MGKDAGKLAKCLRKTGCRTFMSGRFRTGAAL